MNLNINMKEFNKKFEEEYEFLYNTTSMVAGEDEAVEDFEEFANEYSDFVDEFVKYRGDYISSDREAAAFMFVLNHFIYKW